jgi:hypothetical protein
LNHPESFLLEREDILERWEHFPGLLEDNLKVCEHFLHLPNTYRRDLENGRRGLEMFLRQLENILQRREDLLNGREYILEDQENVLRSGGCVRPFEKKRIVFSPHPFLQKCPNSKVFGEYVRRPYCSPIVRSIFNFAHSPLDCFISSE